MRISIRLEVLNTMPYNFLHFLIENKALNKYVNAFMYEVELGYLTTDQINYRLSIITEISRTIDWSKTLEGYNYWYALRKKWELQKSELACKS